MIGTSASPDSLANAVLKALDPRDRATLAPHLIDTDLPRPKVIEVPRRPIGTVYFIESGVVSVVDVAWGKAEVEVGIIGSEGMTGIPLILGDDRWIYSTYMQIGGRGLGIDAAILRRCMDASPPMKAVFLKFVQAFFAQVGSTSTASARGRLDERLARWILMAHDRMTGDTLSLTHEFLAMMLAVRRASVTVTLRSLVSQGLIETGRGTIRVVDRPGLVKCAGSFYGAAETEYQRLLGAP